MSDEQGQITQGQITEADQAKVTEWFDAHWPRPRDCPVSGPTSWKYSSLLAGVPSHDGHNVLPLVVVTCSECAYTMFFSAIDIGIVAKIPKPEVLTPEKVGG